MINQINIELKLGIKPSIPPILSNSDLAIKLGENLEFHKRLKHIDITYHFIREAIKDKKVNIAFIRTLEQLVDEFTKGQNQPKHDLLIAGLDLKVVT